MSKRKSWLTCILSALVPAVALAQASPPPLPPIGDPISDIDRMTRERDANKRFFTKTMATLHLTYNGSGDLRTQLIKTELQSLFMTVQVDGKQIKGIAKNEKPKVQEAVDAGPLRVKGRWSRPGTRRETECRGELVVGFQQVVFLPYGGEHGFSCAIEMRNLPEEVYEEWKAGLDADQSAAYYDCTTRHARGSADFWGCVDAAGVPFPQA